MKALILAGGKGTRLHPVTLETPKPLLTVRKKPILNYLVELFLEQGIYDIGISISAEHKEDFHWWYRRWWRDYPFRFFEEIEPMGTWGALIGSAHFVRNEEFFVTNGDELKRVDLKAMREFHRAHGAPATIALVEHPEPKNYGVAVMDGQRIREFVEKPEHPPTNLISSGLYLFTPEVFAYHDFSRPKFAMLEHDLFPKLAAEGKLHGFPYRGQWYDCGTFERWQKAIEEWDS
ncbi:MAG: hypothetical protein A2991_04225 [Candidatus Terrybacteria bacterium RIFCSPLOWO2_01_FULL_58_14]|uniref:Nucleotidyl transferase domain-containing protein n=2 Tax=Candidatus Terryibacteriota TaxID=1817920 RepID=A0A1G2PY36_9BACT|nr:MAG: hypothetical protein A2682_03375 [Candidatus Terrybacteria bacterium RIFCSPHIGHO2_01_FULL_58_15]OHA52502.1 MAG: hypothetical protein A2991_04225 [Candidatus Terrybacteria bacterium RIFCSPLOWO2_01_FULL_58_14]